MYSEEIRWARFFIVALIGAIVFSARESASSEPLQQRSFRLVKLERGLTKISFPTTETLERADLYFRDALDPDVEPAAILILAPGRNGNGLKLINRPEWIEFARKNQILLCGLSFASQKKFTTECYSNADSGSADLLISGIEEISRKRSFAEIPLICYGFSAGARFVASFVESNPHRILAWCGYAVGRWEEVNDTAVCPPGVVASGQWDAVCYHASLLYFQQGRKLGKPWMWLSIGKTGHTRSVALDEFVREFFIEMLRRPAGELANGDFFDISTRRLLSADEVDEMPIFSSWVPSGLLQESWLELHHP